MRKRSSSAQADQRIGSSALGMPPSGTFEKFVDIERLALAPLQRSDALFEIGAQFLQFADVRHQFSPDLVLIGSREIRNHRDGFLKCLCHTSNIASAGQK